MKTRAAAIHAHHQDWEVLEFDLADPGPGEVLMKFVASGLCHSDEHVRDGSLPCRVPIIGGHEGAGIVEAVGPGVERVEVGDHVVCSFLPTCGHCRWCATGQQQICDMGADILEGSLPGGRFVFTRNGEDYGAMAMVGSFSERTVVSQAVAGPAADPGGASHPSHLGAAVSSPSTAVIVDIVRSPVGRAVKGSLAGVRPDDLAAGVVRDLLARNPQVDPAEIDDVVTGCAFPWGEQGYNVGRCISVLAGLPHHVPAQTITRLCASSLQALRAAGHAIAMGEGDTFVVVGVESVSRVGRGIELAAVNPLLDPDAEGETLGGIFMPMGLTAELVADDFDVTRDEMDRFAQRSQQRATQARESGFSAREITPVALADGSLFEHDESPRAQSTMEGLGKLEPVFRENGRVTAGNSCPLNDGAAAALVMSQERAEQLCLTPRARIVSSAVSAVDPTRMGVGPIEAIRQALSAARLTIDEVDVFELNEAFAAQVIPVCREVGIDPFDDRVNPYGGGIAIGHPFGMTGLRIMSTLLNGLDDTGGRYGIESMCVGGGQGQAMVVERLA